MLVEFFTAQALLGTVALPSDLRFQPLREGMALLGQKDANQTTQLCRLGTPRRGQLLAKVGQGAEIGQLQDLRHLNLFIRVAGAIGAHAKDQLSC